MFTGLVEGQGIVRGKTPDGPAVRLEIEAPAKLSTTGSTPPSIGESVALNGCCLTIVTMDGDRWSFEAGAETLSRTNLGELTSGDRVNVERALPADGRLGGHFVQGHVDGQGTIERIEREGEWITMWFRVPARLTRQMVEKGSITVDGISLTLVNVEDERFSVALIPHTLEVTTLGSREIGDGVNIETDVLGKYVEKMLASVSSFRNS